MRSLKNLGGRVIPGYFRFREPDPGKTFQRLDQLVDFVLEYRAANSIPVESRELLQAEIEDWMCHEMGSYEHYCLEDGKKIPPKDHTGVAHHGNGYQGAAKWKQLHEWAAAIKEDDAQETLKKWLDDFAASLPCGECRKGWRKLVAETPAPLSGGADQIWAWTFDRHNDVNQKIGKPGFDIVEAYLQVHPEMKPPEGASLNPEWIRATPMSLGFHPQALQNQT